MTRLAAMNQLKIRTVIGSVGVGCAMAACTSILGDLPAPIVLPGDGSADANVADVTVNDVNTSQPDTSPTDSPVSKDAPADTSTPMSEAGTDANNPSEAGTDASDGGADAAGAADASIPCEAGTVLCSSVCVSTSTNTDCGGCGLACPSGCNAGECVVAIATNVPAATGIAINAIKAYVTSFEANGDIYVVSLSGGGAVDLTPNFHQAQPYGIAIDNTNIYWTNWAGGATTGSVVKMPISGFVSPTVMAANQTTPTMIAVDPSDQNVYWTNNGTPGNVGQYVLATSTPKSLVSGINGAFGIALDSTYAYVALTDDDYIIKVLLSNGTIAAQVTSFQNNPYGLAIDGTNIYFTNNATSGDAHQVAENATNSAGISLGTTNLPVGIVSDGVNVYWAGNNSIYKSPVGVTNSGKVFVANQNGASFLAVDATSLYWTNSTAGTVMKVTPK